ncbi:MAG: hypothetical protein JO043_04540, partial [Candidatus Eremiobacteraeota bacterium]|nr:hypothetical protein [Candidatus Eremiobacteraeota bacterium]
MLFTPPISRSAAAAVPRAFALAGFTSGSANAALPYAQVASGLQVVGGHLRPDIVRAPVVGTLPPSLRLHLSIGLPLRNYGALRTLAAGVSNPRSAHYRRYLTPAQFAARFSPTQRDYASVLTFAQASGFTVTRTYGHRAVVSVEAPVGAIQQAFHITMQTRRRADGSVFYAPSREPALALSTPILHIDGLDNERVPKPTISSRVPVNSYRSSRRRVEPDCGSGPSCTFAGAD